MSWAGRRSREKPSTATLTQTGASVDSLRVGLEIINGETLPGVLAVTAPVSRDGKASLASALAVTIARSGRKVCLVEADFGDPSLDQSLPVQPGRPALCDVLVGRCTVDDALHEWPEAELTVIPAGTLSGNAAASRAMARMEQVLRELSGRFDVVVVDTPPILPVSDALAIPRTADATIVVVRYGKTKKESLTECFTVLRMAGAEQLSTVMVGMSNRAWRKYSRRVGDVRQRLPEQLSAGTAQAPVRSPRSRAAAPATPASRASTEDSMPSTGAVSERHERRAELRPLPQLTTRLERQAQPRGGYSTW